MVQSRGTTPAREKTPAGDVYPPHMIRNAGYSYCPRTGVKVDDGKSLDEAYNLPHPPAFLFRPANGDPVFNYCFLTGLPIEEVTGKEGLYHPVTVGPNGTPLERIFCTGSGKFLGEYCPYTGKLAAQATTKDGKLIAKTWDSVQKRVISHKFDVHTGVNLKGVSDLGVRASLAKMPSIKKNKSQSAGSNKSGPGSPLKPLGPIKYPTKPESHGKPATTKPKTKTKPTKPAATAASKRPTRARKEPERLIDETAAHPAVRKTTKKKAAPTKASAKTGAGVTKKKPAAKKAPAKKVATTPKKAPAKKAADKKKPAAKKTGSKTGAGVKKNAAAVKAKANTEKKVLPKKK